MCHKGVDGRRVAAPEERAARIPSLTENNTMFFVGLRTAITRFRLCRPAKRCKCPRGHARAPWQHRHGNKRKCLSGQSHSVESGSHLPLRKHCEAFTCACMGQFLWQATVVWSLLLAVLGHFLFLPQVHRLWRVSSKFANFTRE